MNTTQKDMYTSPTVKEDNILLEKGFTVGSIKTNATPITEEFWEEVDGGTYEDIEFM